MKRYARVRPLMILAALAIVAGSGHAAPVKPVTPYDFKGIALGISLGEMREQRVADVAPTSSYVFCTGDEPRDPLGRLQVEVSADEAAAGVVRCAYYEQSRTGFMGLIALSLADSEYVSRDYSFDFIADPRDGEMRLYRIDVDTRSAAHRNILIALEDRFGPPARNDPRLLQNGFGALYDGAATFWSNGVSRIRVRSPSGRLDHMDILYTHIRLAAHAAAEITRARKAAPGRM